ncbi:MAG: DUF4263 domain-containing protein [Chitinophagales bacterium]
MSLKEKKKAKQVSEIAELVQKADLSNDDIKEIINNQRKKAIKGFYYFLKRIKINSKSPFEYYKTKNKIKENGEEAVWHHFLKENDWIIGLNVDLKFIREILPEQKIGDEDSKGKGSSKTDFLGLSYFTTLIELKTSKTLVFKSVKSSKARTNTFDFSSDFIEAYSQTLAQKSDLSINDKKKIIDTNNIEIDRVTIRTIDPKCILIIGCRNAEFPHDKDAEHSIKTDCFERLRRDIRNISIITFDELFERAYHIVYTNKLPQDWYFKNTDEFINKYLN